MNSIGSLLKNVRINANFTQKEIAKELFVTQSYISQVENGAKLPTKKFLKLFSLLFSLDKSELIDMRKNNDLPYFEAISRRARNRRIVSDRNAGMSCKQLSIKYHLTAVQILNILNAAKDSNKEAKHQ